LTIRARVPGAHPRRNSLAGGAVAVTDQPALVAPRGRPGKLPTAPSNGEAERLPVLVEALHEGVEGGWPRVTARKSDRCHSSGARGGRLSPAAPAPAAAHTPPAARRQHSRPPRTPGGSGVSRGVPSAAPPRAASSHRGRTVSSRCACAGRAGLSLSGQ
jgi:hypothetical protein